MDEFESIARLFRPLAADAPEAAGLEDDAAFIAPRAGFEMVITKDGMVEGVHFLPDDPPDLVARKLLRVNLSDLAAKGAEPFGYVLAVAWPERWGSGEREAFARGLGEDQAAYGIKLLGGDTVSTPGPMTASITALGYAPEGRSVRRSRARAGDQVYVTGTIGDGWLGLLAAQGRLDGLGPIARALADRYRLPRPRLELRDLLVGHASACADVSDGLPADLGHVCSASRVGAVIDLDAVPVSEGAEMWLSLQADRTTGLVGLVTGGDDYELVFTGPTDLPAGPVPVTRIGRIVAGEGVRVLHRGEAVDLPRSGWRH